MLRMEWVYLNKFKDAADILMIFLFLTLVSSTILQEDITFATKYMCGWVGVRAICSIVLSR